MAVPITVDDGGEDALRPPEIPDPDAGAMPQPSQAEDQPLETLPLDAAVDAMKQADAPPAAPAVPTPDVPAPPPASLAEDVGKLVDSDRPVGERAKVNGEWTAAPEKSAPAPAAPPAERGKGRVPQSFLEFQQAVAGMKRADGGHYDSRAVANLYRRYQQIGQENGMEAPAGMEALEIHMRESEAGFAAADKQRLGVVADLSRLLTQAAIENMREITQLRDALIRNRH